MSLGIWQILLIVLVVVLLFGRGKISEVMGDFAKGIKSFKSGLSDETDEASQKPQKTLEDNSNSAMDTNSNTRENMRVG